MLAVATTGAARAAEKDVFAPLFNGRDLHGWVNVNCAPDTWSVQDGIIHCTGQPTGALRTVRQYENFVFEVEWRHLTSGGNAGIFIWASPIAAPGVPFLRAVEVQVLDHGYNVPGKNVWYTTNGDVFPIHGSSMRPFGKHNGERSFPSEERSKGSPEWNHYRIECNNGVIRLSVNGKEVSGGENCNYRKGYLGLESEGAPVEFRNLRIRELPSSSPSPEVAAPRDLGWKSLFTGPDLRGWKQGAGTGARWRADGERIVLQEGTADSTSTLWTEQQFGDTEFVVDCRATKTGAAPMLLVRGGAEVRLDGVKPDGHTRFVVTVRGREVTVKRGQEEAQRFTLTAEGARRGPLGLRDTGGGLEFMNLYVRELR